jgi:hypothetical protein
MSRIRSRTLKFQAPCSLSPHLAIFHPRSLSLFLSLSRSSIALETVSPPVPSAVLDPGPGARRRLVPGPGAHHRLILGPGACHLLDPGLFLKSSVRHRRRPRPYLPRSAPPPSTSTPPPSECTTAILFLMP